MARSTIWALGLLMMGYSIRRTRIARSLSPVVSTSTTNRSPAVEQITEAIVAGTLFGYAAPRRDRAALVARLAGSALLVAAFAPALVRRLLHAGAARRRVHLRTSIELDRPVHEVFEFCRDFENFPRVIQSLHSVTDFQDGRSR